MNFPQRKNFPTFFLLLLILIPAAAWSLDADEGGKPIKGLSEHAASMDMVWIADAESGDNFEKKIF